MNRKILIGSIIAVVILVLVSFTGVVGYQTTKSSTIAKASPLFNIRTQRAIGEESKDIACDYVGKGEETSIYLTSRIKRAEQVQKVVDIISKMDDRAFIKYFGRIINQKQMTDEETSDLLQAFHYIRENSNDKKYYDKENNPRPETGWYFSCDWFPGCNILDYFLRLNILIFAIWTSIINWFSSKRTCNTPCQSALAPTHWPCC